MATTADAEGNEAAATAQADQTQTAHGDPGEQAVGPLHSGDHVRGAALANDRLGHFAEDARRHVVGVVAGRAAGRRHLAWTRVLGPWLWVVWNLFTGHVGTLHLRMLFLNLLS